VDVDIDSAFAELGLTSDATERDVKAAWRRLASRWHPDRNDSPSASAKMQRINRAVEAIRQSGRLKPQASAHGQRADDVDEAEVSPPGDTAQAAGNAAEPPARTLHRKVRLTLEEAAFGCTKVLSGKITATCSPCDGAGYRVLGGHCPACQGSGAIRQRSWFGWVGTQSECDACHGGGIAREACAACAGTGKAATQRYRVSVRFPHGVRHGDVLGASVGRVPPGSPRDELSIRVEGGAG
jgi:molecular chaperone DnaJ